MLVEKEGKRQIIRIGIEYTEKVVMIVEVIAIIIIIIKIVFTLAIKVISLAQSGLIKADYVMPRTR